MSSKTIQNPKKRCGFCQDIKVIFLLILSYIVLLDFHNVVNLDFIAIGISLIVNTIIYGVFMYAVYAICTRALKSNTCLLLGTLGLMGISLVVQLLANNESSYNYSVDGRPIFIDGTPTVFGIFFMLNSPLIFLACLAVYRLIITKYRSV